jgi:hypothetical protein
MSASNSQLPTRLRALDRIEWGPLLACVALVLSLGLQLILPSRGSLPEASGLAARRPSLVRIPQIAEFPAILQAPVFAPDRHPGEAGLPASGGGPLSGYVALGAAAGRSVATAVVSGPGGVTKTLRRGETLEGWRLVAVDQAKVTFERDGVRHALVIGAPAEAVSLAERNGQAPQPEAGAP